MEQYVKGFQRFHASEDVRPVTSCKFLIPSTLGVTTRSGRSINGRSQIDFLTFKNSGEVP